jgi:site-specific DNA recombinase
MKQYLIYNRKSTDDSENQKNSLAYQRMRNIEFAKHAGLSIATLTIPGFCEKGIIDERHSGYKEEVDFGISADGAVQYRVLRPKFLKLVEVLKSGKVEELSSCAGTGRAGTDRTTCSSRN